MSAITVYTMFFLLAFSVVMTGLTTASTGLLTFAVRLNMPEFLALITSQRIRYINRDWDTKVSRYDMLWWLWCVEREDNSVSYPPFITIFHRNDNCVCDSLAPKAAHYLLCATASKVSRANDPFRGVERSVWRHFDWNTCERSHPQEDLCISFVVCLDEQITSLEAFDFVQRTHLTFQ